jgi:superfamily I DNA and/or RNA helicase
VFLEDDGERQLQDLQRVLKRNAYNEFCLDENIVDMLLSGEDAKVREVFDKYVEYVTSLKDKFLLTRANEFDEDNSQSAKDIIEKIAAGISELTKSAETTFFDIVEGLAFKLGDIDNAAGIISKYTTIVGSTCAQAEKSVDLMDLPKDRYDYVIIDEAARANPLDIMIPMMMGTKVILIGDHKQLPHYIESKYVDKFKSEKEQYSEYDEKLLTKSLFQIIYENLETAYKEGRLKFRRTIQIDEQHRMHPTIGSFISREFYDGTIQNGERTVNNKNDYRMFDGKNVVWIDMPIFKGSESSYNHSYARECEVDRIIELIKQFLSNNEGRKLDIGIISFYKGQVNLIDKRLKESFPTSVLENISCNTVDSYQGKEFDIVIISGTRSNTHADSRKSLGFIDCSASRINVALSRARKVLVMVADADTYRRNSHFSNFIEYVKDEGYYGI